MSKTKEAMMEFTNGFHHTDLIWPGSGWRKPKLLRVKCKDFSLSNGEVEKCEGKGLDDCLYCMKKEK